MPEQYEPPKSATPEYRAWTNMKARCFDKNHPHYPLYGGRGITVHPAWQRSFEAFIADVGPKPEPKSDYSLDRIDNDGSYIPGNVRWATYLQQNRNTSGSVLLSIPQVAERLGMDVRTVRKMVGLKQLPATYVGSRPKVPAGAVEDFQRVALVANIGMQTAVRVMVLLASERATASHTTGEDDS